MTLRRLWLQLHRWVALSLGWVLVFAGLFGSLTLVAKSLDRWVHPVLFHDAVQLGPAAAASLDEIRARLEQEFGAGTAYSFRPPREADDTLSVLVRGSWKGVVYFDRSGHERGRRGQDEGAYRFLFELHSSMLLGDTGKAILTLAAAAYLILLVTGLVLWWPRRWPPSFRIHWRAGVLRASVDLHNTVGVLFGLVIAVSIATGAYLAWPPLRGFVTSMVGEAAVQAPKLPARTAGAPASLDRMMREAQSMFPQSMVSQIQVPSAPHQPVRIRLKLQDDPHPNGLTSVWFHPASGNVLKVARWSELNPGNRLMATMHPLHSGELGGPLLELVFGIAGMALSALGVAGLLLWWKRRRRPTPVQVHAMS
jgi:uncharacterized iron-regulated membrane protein